MIITNILIFVNDIRLLYMRDMYNCYFLEQKNNCDNTTCYIGQMNILESIYRYIE
jgi:hypothetical protein